MKKIASGIVLSMTLLFVGYLVWTVYFSSRSAMQEIRQFSDQNVDVFLKDAKALAAAPVFPPATRERDAGPFLAKYVGWNEPSAPPESKPKASPVSQALKDALNSFVTMVEDGNADDAVPDVEKHWASVLEAIHAEDALDLSWMAKLGTFDHWNLEKNTPGASVDCPQSGVLACTVYGEVHPKDIELLNLARLRLVRGWLAKDVTTALKETRDLARLMMSTERRTTVLFAQAILSIQNNFVQSALARREFAAAPLPLVTEAEMAQQTRFLRNGLPFLSPATSQATFEKVVAELPRHAVVCPLLHEAVSQAIFVSAFYEPKVVFESDHSAYFTGIKTLLDATQTVCPLGRLRSAWDVRSQWWNAESYAGGVKPGFEERTQMWPYLRRASGRLLTMTMSTPRSDKYIEAPVEPRKWGPGPLAKTAVKAKTLAPMEGLTRKSATHFVLTRQRVEQQLLNLNQILQTARAVPYLEPGTGKFHGFLLVTIDSDSVFRNLGLEDGDILESINGIELVDPAKGLTAFQQLREASEVKVRLLRKGKPVTIRYDVKS